MPVKFDHVPLLFAPAEVFQRTGVSERSQRNWRARGFLEPLDEGKHFRADVFDLAVLVVAQLISDKLPVEKAVSWAKHCAKAVAFYALERPEAWDGREFAPGPDSFFSHEAARAVSDRFPKFGRVIPARFFILWSDGTEYWDYDLTHAFATAAPEKRLGAIVVLDLEELGAELLRRQQPLMRLVRSDVPLDGLPRPIVHPSEGTE